MCKSPPSDITITMSSRNNNSSGSRRNLSKVQQQLAAEEQARQKAIKDRRRREYLERKARRDRKARAKNKSSSPSQPTQSVSHNGVTVDGNTFTLPGLRSSRKRQQGLTLGDALSASSKTALEATKRSSQRSSDFKVTKGAFAAFDSDDEDTPQTLVITTSESTRAQQETHATAWSNFRSGKPQPKPAPEKAAVRILSHSAPAQQTRKTVPVNTAPVESTSAETSDSSEDEQQDSWSTDGDYESDGAFGDDDFGEQFDIPEFDDEGY